MNHIKKIIYVVLILIFIYMVGTIGYMVLEEFSFLDSIYMTAITISTVGFKEVAPLSPAGQVFTIFLIFTGLTFAVYCYTHITKFFVEGELNKVLRGAKMKKMISKLEDHIIICGGGSTAYKIIDQLLENDERFVIIEYNEEKIEFLKSDYAKVNLLTLHGDATRDELLIEAGIEKAKAIISILPDDALNLFVSLSSKSLNHDISVITRAIEVGSEKKLEKAGADYIISPTSIAAARMANIASKSNVMDFINFLNKNDIKDLNVELVEIPEHSPIINKTLLEADIRKKTNLNIIGIEEDGKLKLNPGPSTIIKPNCKLLVFGNDDQINNLINID